MNSVVAASHRAGWGLADQAISSLTNFTLAVFVARSVSPTEFGAFAITLATYYIVSGVGQALVGQPLAIKYSAHPERALSRAAAMASGTALSLGLLAGIATAASTILLPKAIAGSLLVLSVMLPGLLLQDAWRFAFVTAGQPRSAAANDLLWAALQGLGFVLLWLLHETNAPGYVAVWGGAATLSAVVGCLQAGAIPSVRQSLVWLRSHRELALRYTLESLVVRGSSQLSLGAIGLIAGLSALGGVRGAQLLFSPLNLVFLSGFLIAVPEAVRVLHRAPARFVQALVGVSGASAGLAALWMAALLLLPLGAGSVLLGATWASARPLLLAVALQNIAIGVTMGPQVGLRALAAAEASLKSQLAYACFVLTSTSAGAWLAGAQGAAIGIALGTVLGAAVWWPMLLSRAKSSQMTLTSSPQVEEPHTPNTHTDT